MKEKFETITELHKTEVENAIEIVLLRCLIQLNDVSQIFDFKIHYAELFYNGFGTIYDHKKMNEHAERRRRFALDMNDNVRWHSNQPEENFQSIENIRFFNNLETFFENL